MVGLGSSTYLSSIIFYISKYWHDTCNPNTKCAILFGKLSNGSKSDILMAKTREER